MSIQIAWPICNLPSGDYAAVANSVCLGRPFRQPLNLPDANNFVDGLELWLRADTTVMSLYACFNGFLSFYPSTGNRPALLRLSPHPTNTQFRKLNTVEPVLVDLVYANVDIDAVKAALKKLIEEAYKTATKEKEEKWHPVMRGFYWGEKKLKLAIDATKETEHSALIQNVVTHFLEHSASLPPPPSKKQKRINTTYLPLLPGDIIGEAATAFSDLAPPNLCDVGAAPRQLILKVEERGEQVRNPLYDLWSWLNRSDGKNSLIKLQAPHQIGTPNPHPIAQVTNLSLNTPKPPARVETTANTRPVPMLELADYHSYGNSQVEWHLNDDGLIETRLRDGETGALPNLDDQNAQNFVKKIWENAEWHKFIIAVSNAFQIPIELIVAFVAKEAALETKAVRFEAVQDTRKKGKGRLEIDQLIIGKQPYDSLVDRYKKIFPTGNHKTINGAWNPNEIAIEKNGETLTWGEIEQLLRISKYFRTRISPGLMQTLISVAIESTGWVSNNFKDIQNTFPVSPAPANWWDYFGVEKPPAEPEKYLSEWLLNPKHSILAGAAHIRKQHNNQPIENFWDPPKVAAAYNAGSIMGTEAKSTWGLNYNRDYMIIFGSAYNAAVDHINTHPDLDPAPSVRLRR